MRIHNQNRRAMKENLINDFTFEQWMSCLDYFDHSCAYCGLSEDECKSTYGKLLEQEHFVPITKGGGYTQLNILPSCRSCNGSKYNNYYHDWYPNQKSHSQEREEKIISYFLSILDENVQININSCKESKNGFFFYLLNEVV